MKSAFAFVERYSYDVFGKTTIKDANSVLRTASAFGNRFMFTGRELDSETGLYYYRARYYNPHIGRFVQTDPIGYYDSMNLYQYCLNNPTNLVDPMGLDVWIGHHGLHMNINVGKPRGDYVSYSYALKGSRFNMLTPFTRKGMVYEDYEEGLGTIYRNEYFKTTPEEDETIKDGFKTVEGAEGPYDLFVNNCRTFSKGMFKALKERFGDDKKKHNKCPKNS